MYSVPRKRKRHTQSSSARSSRNVKPGRPMKPVTDLTASAKVSNIQPEQASHQVHLTAATPVSVLSAIEQLPNELIQQIFFDCFEINLPKASLHLGRALSDESTYHALILYAFFDDDQQHPVETRLFYPVTYRPLCVSAKVKLQQEILSCRWCTLTRIRMCLPALCKLAMTQQWWLEKEEIDARMKHVGFFTSLEPATVVDQVAVQGRGLLPDLHDVDEMCKHFFARSDLQHSDFAGQWLSGPMRSSAQIVTSDHFLPRLLTWSATINIQAHPSPEICKVVNKGISTVATRAFPDCLVRGSPWTQEKVELLQLLYQGSQFVQEDNILEISAAAVFEGMASAIREGNITALLTLLALHNDVFEKQVITKDDQSMGRPTYHPLPAHLFELAAKAEIDSSKMMWALIRGGIDVVPLDDMTLTRWALKRKASGDGVARWLLDHMSGAGDHQSGDERQRRVVIHGAFIHPPRGQVLPHDLTFVQELNYLEQCFAIRLNHPTNLSGGPCG